MENEYIGSSIKELIEDLDDKADRINKAAEDVPAEIKEKADYIRVKASAALNDAASKIMDLKDSGLDDDQISELKEMIISKSDSLYNEALVRISELKDSVSKDRNIEEDIGKNEGSCDQEKKNDTPGSCDHADEGKKGAGKTADHVTEMALDTLKGWLSPESDDK